MALETPKDLAWIRSEVMTRCTIRTDGDRGARAVPLIDSCIRSAQKRLVLRAPWVRLKASVTIALTTGTSAYDFPDTMDPGGIAEVWVRRVADQKYAPVMPEPTQYQRNALATSTLGQPMWYWFNDQNFNVSPSPDTAYWDQLRLDGRRRATDLVNDTDPVSVDDEALIQFAEILARPKLKMAVDPEMKPTLLAYLSDLAAQQTEGAGFVLGGATSAKVAPESDDDDFGKRAGLAYDAGWNPPGLWG